MKKISNIPALLATVVLLSGCVIGEKKEAESLLPGAPMPLFSAAGGNAGSITASDLSGKRTLVVLFRTTCPDCQRELPKVEAAFRAVGTEANIRFVAITKEANAAIAVTDYWTLNDYTMPWYIDDGVAFTGFDVHYVPTLYLFGTDGKVVFVVVEKFKNHGINTADDLIELINDLQ